MYNIKLPYRPLRVFGDCQAYLVPQVPSIDVIATNRTCVDTTSWYLRVTS